MKPELIELWAVTLESGNYAQGFGALRDNNNRCCCLGVLCDIVEPASWSAKPIATDYNHESAEGGSGCYPSNAFLKKVGLSHETSRKLANLNDDRLSFKEIAAEVRKLNSTGGERHEKVYQD